MRYVAFEDHDVCVLSCQPRDSRVELLRHVWRGEDVHQIRRLQERPSRNLRAVPDTCLYAVFHITFCLAVYGFHMIELVIPAMRKYYGEQAVPVFELAFRTAD